MAHHNCQSFPFTFGGKVYSTAKQQDERGRRLIIDYVRPKDSSEEAEKRKNLFTYKKVQFP
jgi:hypothetical protein